jgi:hypothetical protein
MTAPKDRPVSRRAALAGLGATVGVAGLGLGPSSVVAGSGHDDHGHDHSTDAGECPETTIRPSMVHYDDSIHAVCSDDHPETRALQAAVKTSLETEFSTVGSLVDAGYIPYFDFFADGDWSHWINPAFIGDDSMVDPDRPESVLVDHTWWRPIGVMFMATADGVEQDPPPAVYEDEGACTPWHAHVGLPGRYAWWKYQTVYGHEVNVEFPCRTPWMMHVWIYPHSESVYAHDAPEYRGGPPATDPGFETDADPDEEEFGPEHLPDIVRSKADELWGTAY